MSEADNILLSISSTTNANPEGEVLSKENGDWNIWEEE